MHFQSLAALASLAMFALANPIPQAVADSDVEKRATPVCTNGVVVYGVAGSQNDNPSLTVDPKFYGRLPPEFTSIANALISKAGGGYLQAIAYPASYGQSQYYGQSVQEGVASLQDTIKNYVTACPNGKIMVLGYSQGGQVTTGALGGSTSRPALQVHGRTTGAVAIADPTFQDGREPIDQGTGANNGRSGTVPGNGAKYDYLNSNFATRLRSYCQDGDEFCDSGAAPNALQIHLDAPAAFAAAAQQFLLSLL